MMYKKQKKTINVNIFFGVRPNQPLPDKEHPDWNSSGQVGAPTDNFGVNKLIPTRSLSGQAPIRARDFAAR
jgi:hypothetical protein